jgi:hypothetical protein
MPKAARRSFPRPVHALVGLSVLTAATAIGTPAFAAGPTAASVLKQSGAAIGTQTSAHLDFVAKSGSSTVEKIVGDLGRASGSETVSRGKEVLVIRVTRTDGYVSGSSTGLTELFGLSAAQAKKVGAQWEVWRAGTAQYTDLKENVTLTSLKSLLPPATGTTMSTEGSKGATSYLLSWTSAATSSAPQLANTLRVSAKGSNLPVEETSVDSSGVTVTTKISKWGKPIAVQAPPSGSTIASSAVKS